MILLKAALEATQAYESFLGLHEYSAPTIWFNTNRSDLDFRAEPTDEGWLTLRYRKVYRQYLEPWGLRLPLLITECGVDGMVTDRPGPPGKGWKDFAAYWAELGMGTPRPACRSSAIAPSGHSGIQRPHPKQCYVLIRPLPLDLRDSVCSHTGLGFDVRHLSEAQLGRPNIRPTRHPKSSFKREREDGQNAPKATASIRAPKE